LAATQFPQFSRNLKGVHIRCIIANEKSGIQSVSTYQFQECRTLIHIDWGTELEYHPAFRQDQPKPVGNSLQSWSQFGTNILGRIRLAVMHR